MKNQQVDQLFIIPLQTRRGFEIAPKYSIQNASNELKESSLHSNCSQYLLKRHWVLILPFLINFRNCLLNAFQLLENFGLIRFIAPGKFYSILGERSFKNKFKDKKILLE